MTTGTLLTPGGAVQAGIGLYIERKADQDLIALCASSTFAYVLAPRQMGKSSLMVHTVQRLKQRDVACVTIILTTKNVTADQWYRALLIRIADQLRLRTDPQRWWAANGSLSESERFKLFLQEVLPAEITQRVVIFVDEIELTLGLDFADDFFGVLRSIYDERASIPALGRISFVLLGATSPGELVKQPTRAPFNIGQAVTMTDFTFEEAQQFAQGFSLSLEDANSALMNILEWTGGHPYLTQGLCAALLAHQESWDRNGIARLAHITFFRSRAPYNSNLQEVQRTITKRAEDPYAALTTYRTILRRGSLPDSAQSPAKAILKLSGIVRSEGDRLVVRNQIYRTVFDKEWVQEQLELLPNYFWRRIRETAQYAAYILVLPLIVMVIASLLLLQSEAKARVAESAAAATAQQAAAAAESAVTEARILRGIAVAAEKQEQAQKQAAQSAALALHAVARFKDDRTNSLKMLRSAADLGWTPAVDQAMRQIMPPLCTYLDSRVYDAVWPAKSDPMVLAAPAADTRVFSLTLQLWPLPQTGARSSYLSHNGNLLLVSGVNDQAQILDARGSVVPLRGTGGDIERAVWSPDDQAIITIAKTGAARIWNAQNGNLLPLPIDQGMLVRAGAWSADSRSFAIAGDQGRITLWSLDAQTADLNTAASPITDLAWRSDGTQIAIADQNGTLRIWNVPHATEVLRFHTHDGAILAVRWSPKMSYLLTIDSDSTVRVWDAANGAKKSVLQTKIPLTTVWNADDGDFLIVGKDGSVCKYATPEQMLKSDLMKDVPPLSKEEANRYFEELVPSPVAPTLAAIDTPLAATAYPPPTTNTPVPPDPPTSVPDPPTSVPDPPTSVPNPPTSVPDPPTSVPDPPTSVPDPPTAVKESDRVTAGPDGVTPGPTAGTEGPTAVINESAETAAATTQSEDTGSSQPSETSVLESTAPAATATP